MAKRPPNKDRKMKRHSIMLPESFINDLEELRKRLGAKSHSEVIRRAFKLFKKIAANDGEFETVDRKTGERKKRAIVV